MSIRKRIRHTHTLILSEKNTTILALISVVMIALLLSNFLNPLVIADDLEALREAMLNAQLVAAMALAVLAVAEGVIVGAIATLSPWGIIAAVAAVAIAAIAVTITGARAEKAEQKYYDALQRKREQESE